jgi:hypothetical protein
MLMLITVLPPCVVIAVVPPAPAILTAPVWF